MKIDVFTGLAILCVACAVVLVFVIWYLHR